MIREKNIITLYGGNEYHTDDNDSVIVVGTGTALVYLQPSEGKRIDRKLLIAEAGCGCRIPSILYTDDDGITWKYVIMAYDSNCELLITPDENREETIDSFAGFANIENTQMLGYEEAVAEIYRIKRVKDDAFIYQVDKDDRYFYEQGLRDIYAELAGGIPDLSSAGVGNDIYVAMKYICDLYGITIEDYDSICSYAGKNPSARDIAQLSGFVIRSFECDDDWYRNESDTTIVFSDDNRVYVAVRGFAGRLKLIDPGSGKKITSDRKMISRPGRAGIAICRPLPSGKVNKKSLWDYLIGSMSRRSIILTVILSVAAAAVGIAAALFMKNAFDKYVPGTDKVHLLYASVVVLAVCLCTMIFEIPRSIVKTGMIRKAGFDLQCAVYQRVFDLPTKVTAMVDSADLAGRISGLGNAAATAVVHLCNGGAAVFSALLFLTIMTVLSVPLAVVMFAAILLDLILTYILTGRRTRGAAGKINNGGKLASELYQDLKGIEKIRLSGSENSVLYRYVGNLLALKRDEEACEKAAATSTVVATVTQSILPVAAVILAGMGTELSVGDFMAFAASFAGFYTSVMTASDSYKRFGSIVPDWESVSFLFDNEPESFGGNIRPGSISGRIDMDSLVFGYDDEKVFNGLTLHIRSGEYLGITGTSGSGKTTLVRALLGFITPQKGKIYYDNMDLATLDKKKIREMTGVVLQDDSLISGSIADNLSVMSPGMSTDKMMEVLELAGMKEDIEKMPMGLDTVIDSENPAISGGQKQQMLIARALAKEPRMVIFDEATGALDNISQKKVCDALSGLKMTRIVIAHRLSTVLKCDRIVVLDNGRIAEEGTYDQLIEKDGIFADMARRQMT